MKHDFPALAATEAVVPEGLDGLYRDWHFAPAVRSGDTLFVSGIIGAGEDLAVSDDPESQFVQVFETLGHTLRSAGAGFANVIDISTYHVNINAHFAIFSAVKDRYLREPYCAWTAVGVTELLLPGALVELKAIAKLR